jgi:hypothetical protein
MTICPFCPKIVFLRVALLAISCLFFGPPVFAQSPVVTTQPESLDVTAGSTIRFSVVASGLGPLRYSWSFSRTGNGDYVGDKSGFDAPTLTKALKKGSRVDS